MKELLSASEIDAIVDNNEASWEKDGDAVSHWEFWNEFDYHETAYIPMLGAITYVDGAGHQEEIIEYNGAYSTWAVWVVFKDSDGRYFRKSGEEDSWDGRGYSEPLEEVEQVEKTIKVWEKKLDY